MKHRRKVYDLFGTRKEVLPGITKLGWDAHELWDNPLKENRKKLLHKIGVPIDKSTGSYGKLPLFDFKTLKEYRPDIARKLKKLGLNPHVHTKIQLKKMTKTGLIRLVIKLEKFIVSHAYEMYKSKLPRLKGKTTRRFISYPRTVLDAEGQPVLTFRGGKVKEIKRRKTKRKKLTGAAKAKFLARMNKGRRKKGLKPIRSR